jgi:hypothetical protein
MIRTGRILRGLFFLILSISSNYLGDTISCDLSSFFKKSIFAKQILIFLTIFFGIDLTQDEISPEEKLYHSFIIYLLYSLAVHMDYKLTIICFLLIGINYYIHMKLQFYKKKYSKEKQNKYKNTKKIINYILIVLILFGFPSNFFIKFKEFKEQSESTFFLNFNKKKNNLLDFFFKTECKS